MVVERYRAVATENRCVVHGPCSAADAAELAAQLALTRAGGRAVALAVDESMHTLELDGCLTAAGVTVLAPDDERWFAELPEAGVGLTNAVMAVAATGSLVLVTGPRLPRGASLVPPAHVCLVRVDDVVAELGDAIDRLGTDLPSAVMWVGGPSRTSDLEMRPTFGVHGPRSVDVILVGS